MIRRFQRSHVPTPPHKDSYNDDVNIDHFTSAARTYAGKQRKVLQEEHLQSSSFSEHVEEAAQTPFFLALETPTPKTLRGALQFVASSPLMRPGNSGAISFKGLNNSSKTLTL